VNFWCTCAQSRCTHGSIFLLTASYNRGIKSWSNFLYVSLVVTSQTYLFCKSRPLWTFFTMSDFFCLWEKKLLVLYYKQQRNKWRPFLFVWKCEQIRKYLDAFCVYFWACTPALFSLCTFGLFVLTGHTLDAATVTTSSLSQNVVLSSWSCNWVISCLKGRNSPLWKFFRKWECDVKLCP
jgi:hypothetical protein